MLTVVGCAVRGLPALEELDANNGAISNFLGPSPNLSLSEASALGSTKLLDWMWLSSCSSADRRSHGWFLSNFLRSDSDYFGYQFVESMKAAIMREDLEVVKWLCVHFSDCVVDRKILSAAVQQGHVPILEFFLSLEDRGAKVHWGRNDIATAAQLGHTTAARWLYQHKRHPDDNATIERAIEFALNGGEIQLAKDLLPRGRCILDYGSGHSCPEVIKWMKDCGYLRRNHALVAEALYHLADGPNLKLMQQIAGHYSPSPESHLKCSERWVSTTSAACERGDLCMIQWLMEHPMWEVACKQLGPGHDRFKYLFEAAVGHVEVLEYVVERGLVENTYGSGLFAAIQDGNLASVKWLLQHFPYVEIIEQQDVSLMAEAAGCGYFNLVQFFNSMSDDSLAPIIKFRRPDDAILGAAKRGDLAMVEWLVVGQFHTSLTSLEIAADRAARNGRVEVVRWLLDNTDVRCTSSLVASIAGSGNLIFLKWALDITSNVDPPKVLEGALSGGHLSVASWLQQRFPTAEPNAPISLGNPTFETILFIHVHYPACLASRGDIQFSLCGSKLIKWLRKNRSTVKS